ncbi:hypothetical protein EDD21DRAFT_351664 [Dissophora ornata]|nr:hypothetical protein EDD21DRAFT_351664 [Dissophora ornata]
MASSSGALRFQLLLWNSECQATERVSRLCLMVNAEGTSSLYDAMTGRLLKRTLFIGAQFSDQIRIVSCRLKDWTKIRDNVILADVRNVGLCSVMTLCGQPAYDCVIYPSSTHSHTIPNAALEEESVAKAKENLDIALGVLDQQLELKRKRICTQHWRCGWNSQWGNTKRR